MNRAKSVEHAYEILSRYKLAISVGNDLTNDVAAQACLLSMVNVASRTFLGGVAVTGLTGDEKRQTPVGHGNRLGDAVRYLGGTLSSIIPDDAPVILLGDVRTSPSGTTTVRATYGDLSAGVVCSDDDFRLSDVTNFPPAAILSGALAVSECFAHLLGEDFLAGHRSIGTRLDLPERNWREASKAFNGVLPQSAWLLGLGHLGQAYAWTFASLPYPSEEKPKIYLQDYDVAQPSNVSTSVLTFETDLAKKKTRISSSWLEDRGFTTNIIERPFAGDVSLNSCEPNILVTGVDNLETRRLIEKPNFSFAVDAGLGATASDYDGFFVQTFTDTGRAEAAFPVPARTKNTEERVDENRHAFESLGLDQCGMLMAADTAVGVPFVGMAVSCLVISEIVRVVNGGPLIETLAGSLRNIDNTAIYSSGTKIKNPGFIKGAAG
jgi:hypothetical protein